MSRIKQLAQHWIIKRYVERDEIMADKKTSPPV